MGLVSSPGRVIQRVIAGSEHEKTGQEQQKERGRDWLSRRSYGLATLSSEDKVGQEDGSIPNALALPTACVRL